MDLAYVLAGSQLLMTVVAGMYFWGLLRQQRSGKDKMCVDTGRELQKLAQMRARSLTIPLSEAARPSKLEDIVGQRDGIRALRAALCGANPQHVIIYGPPGIGKTCAARLILEEARQSDISPFGKDAKFVEIDATCVRFDERSIADPLIGSVHDPIYQGAGQLGMAGIPQPKSGAVTKAHGGILFLDEIGELSPIQMNKLLKVMEDRKVYFESAYYNPDDMNTPLHIHEIFRYGLPADFRLVGATTRRPEEISPAIRSRCLEIFFKGLSPEEIGYIARGAAQQCGIVTQDEAIELVCGYASNGREAVNLVQICAAAAMQEGREIIAASDVQWVAKTCRYSLRRDRRIDGVPMVGCVNGLAVSGDGSGVLLQIEASALRTLPGKGVLIVNGIIEEEEYGTQGHKRRKKSAVCASVDNTFAVMRSCFEINCRDYDINLNFAGGMPVDGPSAGTAIFLAVWSAIHNHPMDNTVAVTGEITLGGRIEPVGALPEKLEAAKRAGARMVCIPVENREDFGGQDILVAPVSNVLELLEAVGAGEKNNCPAAMVVAAAINF